MFKKLYLTKEKAIRLIEEVRQRPWLWNPDDDEYGTRYPQNRAWAEISYKLNLPAAFLRTKWKNLRDTYKKELNKHPNGYKGSWRYFESLTFLVFKEDTNENVFKPDTNENSENGAPEKDTEEESDEGLVPETRSVPIYRNQIPEKKRRLGDDYNVMFLKSLTPYFKQLEPLRKLMVRSKMQDLLLKEVAAQNSTMLDPNT